MSIRPFLKTRYRVVLGKSDGNDHWLGGKPSHSGATCPNCDIPLLLFWDINCRDSRFPKGKFGSIERLPLFYCWGCVGDLAYQVTSSDRIKILKPEHRREGPNFQ